MSADSVGAYQEALQKLDVATKAVMPVIRVIQTASDHLHDWKTVSVSNIGGGGYPAGVVLSKNNRSINASEWPSAETLHKLLVAWHEANFAVQSAWSTIPQERRIGMSPPPA
jgi:hypothetical protein